MRVASVRHTCNIIYLLLLMRLERVTQHNTHNKQSGYTRGDIQQKRQTKQFPVKLEI